MLQIALAGLHLLALGLGLGAVINRGSALREIPDALSLRRAFRADTLWGIAGLLWVATGVTRYALEISKSVAYYNSNYFFLAKMGMLALIIVLEIGPMITLIRWRVAVRRGASAGVVAVPGTAHLIATVSHLQALLIVVMVFAAAAMARGYNL